MIWRSHLFRLKNTLPMRIIYRPGPQGSNPSRSISTPGPHGSNPSRSISTQGKEDVHHTN